MKFKEIILNAYQSLYQGDVREVLPHLPEASVDMVVTSPPYYGLRKYDGESVVWDGDEKCEHDWGGDEATLIHENRNGLSGGTVSAKSGVHGYKAGVAGFCSLCGAWQGQLGLEPTPELYIKHLCDIFDLCKRVLKKTGTIWVNLDDSYSANRSY